MHLAPEKLSLQAVSARLLELLCCRECTVNELCQLTHFPAQEVECALCKLQRNGYLTRSGGMVQLKQKCDVTEYCGHLKHPGMGRIQFEFSTLADASVTERNAAAFNALSAALSTAGIELKYIDVAISEQK